MTAQFARGSYPRSAAHEPHAALLIDFDNVTMGIRSDLTKELKSLLNSDVIKGKVAVQRAYADWRRYPQYIVPLAEASVDLIFAPAYGSSKKNATDIRLAIDALELVFTRSEIGTFILLSGDSDFSSLVLKLKEYGKYVIGVGIRESASDLLVQNCDEYYSYSALTGLTRTTDHAAAAGHDPWETVEVAVRQMVAEGDVMRSDRLKQVMLDLDPSFDEKTLGFTKFNRFVQEAANRGLLRLQKMDNGQYEVALSDGEAPAAARGEEERESRRGRGRRSRGRREEQPRQPVAEREEASAQPEAPAQAEPSQQQQPAARVEAPAQTEPALERAAEVEVTDSVDLRAAYDLLRRAAADVADSSGGVARDSDVKRRMLEIRRDWDESAYGFSKFSRFLRQAHDANVITLRRLENGNYEVSLRTDGAPLDQDAVRATAETSRPDRQRRDRRAGRPPGAADGARPSPATKDQALDTKPASEPVSRAAQKPEAAAPDEARPAAPEPARPAPAAARPQPAAPAPSDSTAVGGRSIGVGLRRGSRGRSGAPAPPPLLEGQAVVKREPAARAAEPAAAPQAAPGEPDRSPEKPAGRGGRTRQTQPSASAPKPEREGRTTPRERKRGAPAKPPREARPPAAKRAPLTPAELGLPVEASAVIDYLASSYKGVGRKSGEMLVEAFGADKVFDALESLPDRVREVLGARRGETLLEAWRDDYTLRLANSPAANAAASRAAGRTPRADARPQRADARPPRAETTDDTNGTQRKGRRSRGRRGGRKRGTPAATSG